MSLKEKPFENMKKRENAGSSMALCFLWDLEALGSNRTVTFDKELILREPFNTSSVFVADVDQEDRRAQNI